MVEKDRRTVHPDNCVKVDSAQEPSKSSCSPPKPAAENPTKPRVEPRYEEPHHWDAATLGLRPPASALPNRTPLAGKLAQHRIPGSDANLQQLD